MEKLGFFVGNADLEDELIRALGIDEVLEVISAQKEHATFETFRKQPAQRGRAVDASFAGSSAHALVASFATPARWWMSFDLGFVPRPLAAVLACCAPAADGLAVQSSVRRVCRASPARTMMGANSNGCADCGAIGCETLSSMPTSQPTTPTRHLLAWRAESHRRCSQF
jgi:hypothetical protein